VPLIMPIVHDLMKEAERVGVDFPQPVMVRKGIIL
jgi:hypothetical protein